MYFTETKVMFPKMGCYMKSFIGALDKKYNINKSKNFVLVILNIEI